MAWRDAVKLLLWDSGVRGRMRLLADSALGDELIRARWGPLLGEAVRLADFGVGQGRRPGVHLF
eukprot:8522440-Pyramimonas_sp.AAC.1